MSPPDSSALLRAMESPSPMPRFLNEMVGWNSEARACSLKPRPGIVHLDGHAAVLRRRHAQDAAALAGGFRGVLQQVGENALHQVLIRHHGEARPPASRQS